MGEEVDERGYGVETERVVREVNGVKLGECEESGDEVRQGGRDL